MKFQLTINLGNEAMQDNHDVAKALRGVADRLSKFASTGWSPYALSGKIKDDNGNAVGDWKVKPEVEWDVKPEVEWTYRVGDLVQPSDSGQCIYGCVTSVGPKLIGVVWEDGRRQRLHHDWLARVPVDAQKAARSATTRVRAQLEHK